MALSPYHCTVCDERIHDDELDDARAAADYLDEYVCDSCRCERDHFRCAHCGECGEETDRHAYVIVVDPEDVDLPLAGLYRVEYLPYYTQPLVGSGWLQRQALTWLGFYEAVDTDDYPCGHLCAPCQRAAVADIDTHALQMLWAAH